MGISVTTVRRCLKTNFPKIQAKPRSPPNSNKDLNPNPNPNLKRDLDQNQDQKLEQNIVRQKLTTRKPKKNPSFLHLRHPYSQKTAQQSRDGVHAPVPGVEVPRILKARQRLHNLPSPQMPCLPPMSPRLMKALSLPVNLRLLLRRPLYPQSPLILPYSKHIVYSHLLNLVCFILGHPHRLLCFRLSRLYNAGSSAQTAPRRV